MSEERVYHGIPVSPGIAAGKTYVFDHEEDTITKKQLTEADIPIEIVRLEKALIETRREITEIQKKIADSIGVTHAEIFNAHLLVLEDRTFLEEIIKEIEASKVNVEFVFINVMEKYVRAFSEIEDDYLKERISDIQDVGKRVLHNLLGKRRKDLSTLEDEVIVIAFDLSPSDTALMHKDNVIAFATDIGGKTSHTAIMARSIGIPAVVGLHNLSQQVLTGDDIIIDGNKGIVYVNPSDNTKQFYTDKKFQFLDYEKHLESVRDLPSVTKDGKTVVLQANIEMPEDIPSIISHGAKGIGLYRTEFIYMNRSDLPSEEEQYIAYRKAAEAMAPKSVVIRTMDMGGDKFLSHLQLPKEMNPFLGWRAIRFCLERHDIFKTQLKAILRASEFGNVKMMYPMISGINEIKQAKVILDEAKEELKKENKHFDENMPVGAMIEIPSAAITADIMAKHVDFFSIGTNDLIQYSLAVDRVNEKIAYLYDPMHPAVLRLVKRVIDAAHDAGITVSMCGEMAGDPASVVFLVAMGIDELSMSPFSIPEIKTLIRNLDFSEMKQVVDRIMKMETPEEISSLANKCVEKYLPEIFQYKF
ncbi:MAG: phosphoenolpyruvate--protein phosphotransferase [Candidatus Aureabacteria bacterium]|nr:phosphoenolpyruvate--protein phosphotransferase [Candidatus Auribacterota bacterium]